MVMNRYIRDKYRIQFLIISKLIHNENSTRKEKNILLSINCRDNIRKNDNRKIILKDFKNIF